MFRARSESGLDPNGLGSRVVERCKHSRRTMRQLVRYLSEWKDKEINAAKTLKREILTNRRKSAPPPTPRPDYNSVNSDEDSYDEGWDTDFEDDLDESGNVIGFNGAAQNGTSYALYSNGDSVRTTEPEASQMSKELSGRLSADSDKIGNSLNCGSVPNLLPSYLCVGREEMATRVAKPEIAHTPMPKPPDILPRPLDCTTKTVMYENQMIKGRMARPLQQPPPPPAKKPQLTKLDSLKQQRIHSGSLTNLPDPPPLPPANKIPCSNGSEDDEEYEVPKNTWNLMTSSNPALSTISSGSGSVAGSICSGGSSGLGTDASSLGLQEDPAEVYEIIDSLPQDEENYEVPGGESWSAPSSGRSSISDKPILPPRSRYQSPPPLPEKPGARYAATLALQPKPPLPSRKMSDENLKKNKSGDEGSSSGGFFTSVIKSLNQIGLIGDSKQPRDSPTSADSVSMASTGSRCSTPDRTGSVQNSGDGSIGARSKTGSETSRGSNQITPGGSPRGSIDISNPIANRPLPAIPGNSCNSISETESESGSDKVIISVEEQPWFHHIEREAAKELLLQANQDGTYLVRESRRAGDNSPYSLSIFHNSRVFHLNIRLRSDGLFALGKEKLNEKTFANVEDMINFHQMEAILLTANGQPAGRTCLLQYPDKQVRTQGWSS